MSLYLRRGKIRPIVGAHGKTREIKGTREANYNWDLQPSEQQIQIMQLASEGKRLKEIAETMGISLSTVKTHLRNLYKRYGDKRSSKLTYCVAKAYREGLIK